MTDPDVIEDLDRAMASMPGEFAYKTMKAAAIEIAALRDEITRLRALPWVSGWTYFDGENFPPIDPDENGTVSIPVLIAYEGEAPNPLDNVCTGWADEGVWYCPDGSIFRDPVVAFLPILPLDPTPEQV